MLRMPEPAIDIVVENESWHRTCGFVEWQETLPRLAGEVTRAAGCSFDRQLAIDLLLTNNETNRMLNRRFRGKDTATNVLSFPQFEELELKEMLMNGNASHEPAANNRQRKRVQNSVHLGDITMAFEKIMSESREFGIEFFARCSHLFVHGMLHILGMDHHDEIEANEMEQCEINILEAFGMKNPYLQQGAYE